MTGEVLIFAGTTEGRELVNYCRKEGIMAEVVVATDYGKELIEESGGIWRKSLQSCRRCNI